MASQNYDEPSTRRVVEICRDILPADEQQEIAQLPYREAVAVAMQRIYDKDEDFVPYLQRIGVL